MNTTPKGLSSARALRSRALFLVLAPTAGVAGAIALAIVQDGVSALALTLFLIFYVLSALGVEVGFHRYFSHRAFKCGPHTRRFLGFCGSMAGQGPVLYWVGTHRLHHRFSDTSKDPHAPLPEGLAGWWRAHVGWLFRSEPLDLPKLVPDLVRDPTTIQIHAQYGRHFATGLIVPALIGLVAQGAIGALEGFLWGGLVRIFANHHATWSVNSLCHLIGTRPYATPDRSRNFWPLAFATMGGAWHNNHHAFPAAACNDFRPWQLDPGAWFIRGLERLGLARDVRRPSAELTTRRAA